MNKIKEYFKIIYLKNIKYFLNKLKPQKINSLYVKELSLKKAGLMKEINKIETLVLGSSHGDYGFNPAFFETIAYNLCYSSQDLYYTYKLYKKFHKMMPKIRNIIIFYSVFSPGLKLGKTSGYPMCSLYKIIFDIPYNIPNIFYTNIENQCIKELISPVNIPDNYSGYANPQIFFSHDYGVQNRVKTHLRENRRNNNQTNYIDKIFKLSQKMDHNLIIIIPPARNDYKSNLPSHLHSFKELYNISKNKFHLLNFYIDEDFSYEDFGDFDHLNYNGAIKLTQKIRVQLNKLCVE